LGDTSKDVAERLLRWQQARSPEQRLDATASACQPLLAP
jgi:hypothetical protein